MKFILSLVACLFFFSVQAQNPQKEPPEMPMKDGRVFYEYTLELPHTSKYAIYDNTYLWFMRFFPNPKGVMQVKDKEAALIEGKHNLRLVREMKGREQSAGKIRYHLRFKAIDSNMVKIEFYDFRLDTNTDPPINEMLRATDKQRKMKYNYLQQVHDHCANMIEVYKKQLGWKEEGYN